MADAGRTRHPSAADRRAADRHHRRDDGRVAAGARHDHRQRRAAAHAGELERDPGHDQLGADELHRRLGHRASDQRLAGRQGRAQAPPARSRSWCSPLASVLCATATSLAGNGPVPRASGRRRRVHRAARPGDIVRYQPARKARPGDGPVRRRGDDRPDSRAGARRVADRQLQLALGVSGQPAGRSPLRPADGALHAQDRDS